MVGRTARATSELGNHLRRASKGKSLHAESPSTISSDRCYVNSLDGGFLRGGVLRGRLVLILVRGAGGITRTLCKTARGCLRIGTSICNTTGPSDTPYPSDGAVQRAQALTVHRTSLQWGNGSPCGDPLGPHGGGPKRRPLGCPRAQPSQTTRSVGGHVVSRTR